MKTVGNNQLEISVAEFGAEMQSIKSKKSGREFMWQNESGVWGKHAPVLFPNIGERMGGKITVDGKEYPAIGHGFACKSEFEVADLKEDSVTMLLRASEETKKYLPYDFEFYLTYSVSGSTVKIRHEIKNTDNKRIYFSVGAHPGFKCKIGDVLEFEKKETKDRYVIGEGHYISEVRPYLKDENEIVIKEDTFIEDAVILKSTDSDYVTLKSKTEDWSVKVNYYNAEYIGFWAKPGAEYVCIEPWFGIDDFAGDTDFEIKNKRGIVGVDVGGCFEYDIDIEIFEQ